MKLKLMKELVNMKGFMKESNFNRLIHQQLKIVHSLINAMLISFKYLSDKYAYK